jgi:hypothetical protein
LRFSLLLRAAPEPLIYGVELLDSVAGVAARARYPLDATLTGTGLLVSDLLLSAPFDGPLPTRRDDPVMAPLTSLVVPAGATLGVYAELYRSGADGDAIRVEFGLEPADRPGLLGRLARWVGRATGILGSPVDPRVAWSANVESGVQPLAVNLPLDPRRRGRHVLVLRVTDLRTGTAVQAQRPLLIVRQ